MPSDITVSKDAPMRCLRLTYAQKEALVSSVQSMTEALLCSSLPIVCVWLYRSALYSSPVIALLYADVCRIYLLRCLNSLCLAGFVA